MLVSVILVVTPGGLRQERERFLLDRNSEFMNRDEVRGITTPPRDGRKPVRAWTDDYTGIFPLLIWCSSGWRRVEK